MSQTPVEERPDTSLFTLLHRAMRVDATRFAAAVAELDAADSKRIRDLESWFGHFSAVIHQHHTDEDEIFFPALSARVGDASGAFQHVATDHTELDHLFAQVATGFERLATPAADRNAEILRLVNTAGALRRLLEAHLDLEDREVVPLFDRFFTAAEYQELDSRAKKAGSLRVMAFMVPWVVEHAGSGKEELLRTAEPALRFLYRVTVRRYRRIDAALG